MGPKWLSHLKNLILVRFRFWRTISSRFQLSIIQKSRQNSMHLPDKKYQSSSPKLNMHSLNLERNWTSMSSVMRMMLVNLMIFCTLLSRMERTRILFSKLEGLAQPSSVKKLLNLSILEISIPSKLQSNKFSFRTEEGKVKNWPGKERKPQRKRKKMKKNLNKT